MSEVKCPSCGTSIHVHDNKAGLWWGIGCLVAALAIPFIMAVIGLLAAIAIPSFMKARDVSQQNMCINNMRMIDAAKELVATDHNYKAGDIIPVQEVSQYVKEGFSSLVCPNGGHYTVNPVGQEPECSEHGRLSDVLDVRTRCPGHTSPAPPPRAGHIKTTP